MPPPLDAAPPGLWPLILTRLVDGDVDNIVLAKLRDETTSQKSFNAFNMLAASQYMISRNINLEEALGWSQRAAGTKTFATLTNLSTNYAKLNRLQQADSTMNEALVFAVPGQFQDTRLNLGL